MDLFLFLKIKILFGTQLHHHLNFVHGWFHATAIEVFKNMVCKAFYYLDIYRNKSLTSNLATC